MRKLSVAVIASFTAVVATTSFASSGIVSVGGDGGTELFNPGTITIEKTINGDGTTPPDNWEFTVVSQNCGMSIESADGLSMVGSRVVTTPSDGGSTSVRVEKDVDFMVGSVAECLYSVTETPVVGWTSTPSSFSEIIVRGDGRTVTFENAPAPTTTLATTTTLAPTTTAASATTVAATTPPPTVTVGGDLPATGSSEATRNAALIAVFSLLLGLGALATARRRSTV